MASRSEALAALHAYGISADSDDCRLHAAGWDSRRLHRRLAVLLAGVDDLTSEWDATAELVRYHHDRRLGAGVEIEPWDILADVETAMRSCVPLPHAAPNVVDVDTLLQLIAAAEDAYLRLIAEHVDFAERVLDDHIARVRQHGSAKSESTEPPA